METRAVAALVVRRVVLHEEAGRVVHDALDPYAVPSSAAAGETLRSPPSADTDDHAASDPEQKPSKWMTSYSNAPRLGGTEYQAPRKSRLTPAKVAPVKAAGLPWSSR